MKLTSIPHPLKMALRETLKANGRRVYNSDNVSLGFYEKIYAGLSSRESSLDLVQ